MMQDISEVLELKHEHRAIYATRTWFQAHFRAMLKTILLSLVGLVVLVGLSCVLWLVTWHGDVQFKLGQLYEEGSHLTSQNYAKAFTWYGESAAKGDISAKLKLADMYVKGKGIHQDLGVAVALYRNLADQGNAVAQYQLGEMYLSGQAVTQNLVTGLDLLAKSANQDNPDAAFSLGNVYAEGFGADADEQNILNEDGVVYNSMTEGVSQNYKRSAAWYLQAATLGHADAQSALGMLYFQGKGVTSNHFTAYILEAIATARGSIKAPILRNQVMVKLSQDQIMAAQPFIDHWVVGQPIIFAE